MTKETDIEADSVMLKSGEADVGAPMYGSRPLTEDELESFCRRGSRKREAGLVLSPTFFVKEFRDRDGKRKIVPFVGIRGSF